MNSTTRTLDLADLRATYPGRVILPGDAGYDQARAAFYGWVDKRPAAIIRVANNSEVARVIKLARETGLELAMFVNSIDRTVSEKMLEHLNASNASLRVAQLRILGGAISRVPVDATAYAHRKSRIMINVACLYKNLGEAAQHEAWVTRFAAALDQGDPAAYVNFLVDEGPERVRAAYPQPTWDRLERIKQRYDPDNLFHVNQNIPPAT